MSHTNKGTTHNDRPCSCLGRGNLRSRQTTWGKPLKKNQQPNHIQICFQNVGGIIPTADDDLKLMVLRQFTQQHQIDVFGFAEHNACWDVIPKQQQLAERTKGWWENAHWTTAFNKQDKNPTAHQPGAPEYSSSTTSHIK